MAPDPSIERTSNSKLGTIDIDLEQGSHRTPVKMRSGVGRTDGPTGVLGERRAEGSCSDHLGKRLEMSSSFAY
jgi:hypothetical protein